MIFLPNHNLEQTSSFLEYVEKAWLNNNDTSDAILECAILYDGIHIGAVSIEINDGISEVGWILNRKYQKQGFAYEAASALIDYAISIYNIPFLEKNGGVILNTSSMVSIYGQPSGVMYPASKFAVNGMTKSLSRELAPFGVRVNAVAPGITETDMVKNLPKEMIEPLIKTIPLGRIGKPEDVANAFLFLASDMASYVTGEILSVDGAAMN